MTDLSRPTTLNLNKGCNWVALGSFLLQGKTKWSQWSNLSNQHKKLSLSPFRCLCSNVSSEHETQPEFKESRVPQHTRLIPCFDELRANPPQLIYMCWLADLVARTVQGIFCAQKSSPNQCKDHSSIRFKDQRNWLMAKSLWSTNWMQPDCGQGEGNCSDVAAVIACETKCRSWSETLL